MIKPFKVDYPEGFTTRKSKIAYWVFRQKYTFDKGRGNVIGQFTGPLPEIGGGIILLQSLGLKLMPLQIAIAIIVAIVLCWLLGYWYQSWKLDKIEK